MEHPGRLSFGSRAGHPATRRTGCWCRRVGVAVVAEYLWVHRGHVVRLHEGLHGQLPIARHDLGDMLCFVAIFEIECCEVLGQVLQIAVEWLPVYFGQRNATKLEVGTTVNPWATGIRVMRFSQRQ